MSATFHIVLCEPEIPPNTGNVIRLCANTGSALHLIHPLGFTLDDKKMKRAGLDYHEFASVQEYQDFEDFLNRSPASRMFAVETCGTRNYHEVNYQLGDAFLFGSETKGLSKTVLDKMPEEQIVKIPMQKNIRSLNLSNSVAVVLYEAWRQSGFIMESVQ